MRIRLSIPDHLVTPQALEAALEATSLANAEAIRRGEIPHVHDVLASGAKWKPEPFLDGEHFDLGHQIVERGWGDCDDWAPLLTGSLIASGEDPGARTRIVKTGHNRWHAVTETSDGRILDPSRWAGMGKRSAPNAPGVAGATAKPFAHPGGGSVCVVPHAGQWWARCDVPWRDGSGHLASHARGRDLNAALERSVAGAIVCGEQVGSPLLDRARSAAQFLLGESDAVNGMLIGDDITTFAKLFQQPFAGKMLKQQVHLQALQQFNGNVPFTPLDGSQPFIPSQRFKTFDEFWPWYIKQPVQTHDTGISKQGRAALGTLKSAASMASSFALPGVGPGMSTASALARGLGLPNPLAPEGGQVVRAPSGAVSVPLESPDAQHSQHMFLYYHPHGAPGPVIMRF